MPIVEQVAESLKEFSNTAKLKIIESLASGPRTTTEIAIESGLEMSYTSLCLKRLQRAGILSAERNGRSTTYRIQPGHPATSKVLEMLGH